MTIRAEVVADSVSPRGVRLTTLQLRYPRFIHAEFMTHRVFSRCASSSRAIPVERLIADVLADPVYPSYWGANQRGMQAAVENTNRVATYGWGGGTGWSREGAWRLARENAVSAARAFAEAGYHKQVVNRLLEPFSHINVVVTATEWSNFFALRCHPAAQPEMRVLAEAMRTAMAKSDPVSLAPGQWHLPYVPDAHGCEVCIVGYDPLKVSVARVARVSYKTHDGREPDFEEDLRLYARLVGSVPLHASPTEHQATPDEWRGWSGAYGSYERPELHGNLRGWVQFRKTLAGECQWAD